MNRLTQEAYRAVLEALPTGVYLVDRDRRILLWSNGAEELTGYLRPEVVGRACRDDLLMHCDDTNTILCGQSCPLQQTIQDGHTRTVKVYQLHKDGRRIPVTVRAAPLRDEKGALVGAIGCFERREVSPAVEPAICRLSRDITVDRNTGLPDWVAMQVALRAYLDVYQTSAIPFAVLAIEVVGLQELRRTRGRNAVDAVQRATGNTIAENLGQADIVGIWSSGYFLAVVTACGEAALNRVIATLKQLVRMERVPWWGESLHVRLRIGSAVVEPYDTLESLLARAEESLESERRPHAEEETSSR